MFGRLTVYSKIYKYNPKTDDSTYLKQERGRYVLLERVYAGEWYDENNKGLAQYLDTELQPYVDKIHYGCENGMIEFNIIFKTGYDENDIVIIKQYDYKSGSYQDYECTLKEAVCKYLQGQISDGWGEGGLYILDNKKDKVFYAYCGEELFEKDYKKSHDLALKANNEYAPFDDYPAYKPVVYGKNCKKCKHSFESERFGTDCPYWRNKPFPTCPHYEEE